MTALKKNPRAFVSGGEVVRLWRWWFMRLLGKLASTQDDKAEVLQMFWCVDKNDKMEQCESGFML